MAKKAALTLVEKRAQLMKKVVKKYSGSAVVNLAQEDTETLTVSTTGCLSVDLATGVGGLPGGRWTEIYGKPGAGKTTFATALAAYHSQFGRATALIEPELKLLTPYFRECVLANGGDLSLIEHIKPESGKAALEIMKACVGLYDFVIVDSAPAIVTTKELDEGDPEKVFWAANARLVSQFLKQINPKLARSGLVDSLPVTTHAIFINQVRADMDAKGGDKLKPAGGWAWRHAQSLQIKLTPLLGGALILDPDDNPVGINVKAFVNKNVLGLPKVATEFLLRFGEGPCRADDVLKMSIRCGLIEQKGAYYWFPGTDSYFAHGSARAIRYLRDNPELRNGLRLVISERIQEWHRIRAGFVAVSRMVPRLLQLSEHGRGA